MTSVRRRRLVVAAGLAVLALLVAMLLTRGPSAPAVQAERLVPADALLFVHASTDDGRDEDRRLLGLLEDFEAFRTLRGRLEETVGPLRDARAWLGDEAAIAVTPRGTIALLAVDDEDRARAAVQRRLPDVDAAFADGFLVLGPKAEVARAVALASDEGRPLARHRIFARLAEDRPQDRVLDVWAGPGARRFAGPAAARLPDAPVLATVAPVEGGLQLRAHAAAAVGEDFTPELVDAVPADAVAYLGLRRLQPLVDLLPRTGPAAVRFIETLGPLVRALDREAALIVSPGDPDPVVTIAGRASDPDAAQAALGSLQGVVAQLLVGSEADTGLVPTFEERDLGGGVPGSALRLAGGGEVVIAVREDRLAISTAEVGVRRALTGDGAVEDVADFRRIVGEAPDAARLLLFVHLSRLLDLGERAGLSGLPGYQAARKDARKLRAAGAVVRRQANDTTVELNLQIR